MVFVVIRFRGLFFAGVRRLSFFFLVIGFFGAVLFCR